MSTSTDIADAVVTALNAASLVQTFTASRHFLPVIERDELSTLTVSVAPAAWDVSLLDRSSSENEYAVDIGVQKQFTSATRATINTELDPLMTFMEAIADLFHRNLIGDTGTRCRRVTNDPIFSPDAFLGGEFRSVVRLFCWKSR
jgi:hypothetical protein